MRFVLALMAVIGLLTSPAMAAAAQVQCLGHGGDATMPMSMAGMPGMAQAGGQTADPCCDPGKDQGQTKHGKMDCAQACAAMCGAVAALPSAPATLIARPDRGAAPQARVASLKPHEPSRLERPPRSIA